jgi:hypothetical protein
MPFCTIVEFAWSEDLDRARFEQMIASSGEGEAGPEGRLVKIMGIDDAGARVVEVWRSGQDAMAFAQRTAPVTGQMPAPSRAVGFEVTTYDVA